ncbi:uncharacterized protein LOC132752641 isoform X3 [Ruditapes philippinarum]|uniref:uncharacterized protein LOC132752641 isoform X3 n=1 Tax=Ruditapes philippinarum TaxID=129788 RepID=UPI00295BD976|nr:uncharacterized protein LOC132752641 isoform X3 [Ruditapes philippinarum]
MMVIAGTICETTLQYHHIYSGSTYEDLYPFHDYVWYNTTFWDGYMRVAWKDNIGPQCKNIFKNHYFLVLTDEHKDIIEFKNNLTVLQACIMSQDEVCASNTTVDVLYCDGDLMYRFSDNKIWSLDYIGRVYICFDKIYFSNCSTPGLDLPAEHLNSSAKLVKVNFSETEIGWYNSMYDGQNYIIPLIKDINVISAVCYGDDGIGLYSQDEQYLDIGDVAEGQRVCEVSKSEYYFHESAVWRPSYICDRHVYVRSCHGKIQLDLTLKLSYEGYKCLVQIDVVKVIPEIRHTVKYADDGLKIYKQYDPFLQFKCSFKMLENLMYIVKWYLNGHYVTEKGPSRHASVLAIKEEELGVNKLNYKVKCAVSVHSKNRSDPIETTSDDFFAGFMIIDPDVSLSKSGNEIITVEQTVPVGCAYNDTSSPTCEDTVSVVDKNLEQNICSNGVFATNANSPDTPYYVFKTLKQDEIWDGMTRFAFKLETVDRTYDDKDTYDLFITHSGTNAKSSGDTCDAKVTVTNLEYSKNKICYSHVDSHMLTGNGRPYEQQREGDFILYRNMYSAKDEILVLERAGYCFGNSGPVCACAIIVRAGADAFMINRCNGQPFEVKFIQCGNGGIIEVVRISDSKYEIYTPIGSKISIHLLDGWANGRNMNVDIYLSSKDEGRTDGLCGQYDKNDSNDFLLREQGPNKDVVENNDDHRFSESWRLKDGENLFKDNTISLRKWNGYVPPICRRTGSITFTKMEKCSEAANKYGRRKRHEKDGHTVKVKRNQLHVTRDLDSRKKN